MQTSSILSSTLLATSQICEHKQWFVKPDSPPQVLRHCPGCQTQRPFYCSEKFRINGNQKNLDVWLIYRCAHCDTTWNYTLYERITPHSLPTGLLPRFEANEAALAWEYAFDLPRLRRYGVYDHTVPGFSIEEKELSSSHEGAWLALTLVLPYALPARLGQLLARGLGVSRSRLDKAYKAGDLLVESARKAPLRRSVTGQELCLYRVR